MNVTLLFGTSQVAAAAEAYRGIERRPAGRLARGRPFGGARLRGRLDTAVDRELEAKGRRRGLGRRPRAIPLARGASAVANALEVWEDYRKRFFGRTSRSSAAAAARPQWMLWASTGTKNPAYSDIKYVEELAGPDSINTMPWETLDAFLEHGVVRGNRLDPRVETARTTRRVLADAGIDLEAHCARLQEEGVVSFAKSFQEMMEVIRERSAALQARR